MAGNPRVGYLTGYERDKAKTFRVILASRESSQLAAATAPRADDPRLRGDDKLQTVIHFVDEWGCLVAR